jgi:hypothetical protein
VPGRRSGIADSTEASCALRISASNAGTLVSRNLLVDQWSFGLLPVVNGLQLAQDLGSGTRVRTWMKCFKGTRPTVDRSPNNVLLGKLMVAFQGFEPRLLGSEPSVLPLNEKAMKTLRLSKITSHTPESCGYYNYSGRCRGLRTPDPSAPNGVRYQAALYTETCY